MHLHHELDIPWSRAPESAAHSQCSGLSDQSSTFTAHYPPELAGSSLCGHRTAIVTGRRPGDMLTTT
eukprot:5130822-Lingulodinium_polyedra.AAC.1